MGRNHHGGSIMPLTRFPYLTELLTGEASVGRQRALDDLKVHQWNRQTKAANSDARKRAVEATCLALKVGA
jgi:hypothetical protein